MNRFISHKFRFYSFVCIALLMFVHGYNLNEGYLQPYSTVAEPLTLTTFVEFLLANGLLRFRIPMLFMISGYIFAMRDHRPYTARMRSRFNTLMVPYFAWSAIGLTITFILQQFPYTAAIVAEAAVDQLGDNRPYREIGLAGLLYRWVLEPVSFQLWFIRSLFFYNLLYPVIQWLVLRFPELWFTLAVLLWCLGFQFVFLEGQGMLFFSLGIWLSKTNYPIDKQPAWYSQFPVWVLFIGSSVVKTFMGFELEPSATETFATLIVLQAITIITGILAVWFGADKLVRWCMNKKWFMWLTAFSFIIYGLHVPLIEYLTVHLFHLWQHLFAYRLLTYFAAPLIVFLTCIIIGAFLRRFAPGFYKLLTGGRGFQVT